MLLIVDGSSIGSRAFYSEPVGFFNMVETVRQETQAEYVVFCFDDNQPSFRQKLYPEYKGGRKRDKDREYFITSVAVALEQTDYSVVWGPEADDVIGSIVAGYPSKYPAYIFSSDTDLWQLIVDFDVHCVWCGRHFKDRQIIWEKDVIKRYGVPPAMIPEYIGLVGESSDNIPGVTGIGEKGAQHLLRFYGDVHDIFEYGDIGGRYEKLLLSIEGSQEYHLSKTLATIVTNMAIKVDWQKARYKPLAAAVKQWVKNGN